jgi:hypothetical protein
MSRHRLEPTAPVRPRYGRVAAAGLSLLVTAVALLGGLGVIPLHSDHLNADASDTRAAASAAHVAPTTVVDPPQSSDTAASRSHNARSVTQALEEVAATVPDNGMPVALPAASGSGRRVVFSKSNQRVWLVDGDDSVASTYLVSGSVTNNLDPGTYHVYSRSRWAVGIEDSGVMEYFVRFAHGAHAAIGFHSIPTKNGVPLQSTSQLGTPQSHGCIRQRLEDAKRLWDFAGSGTAVVVVA